MKQEQRFGLLRYHFSQQETITAPAITPWQGIGPSGTLPPAQAETEYIESILQPDEDGLSPMIQGRTGYLSPVLPTESGFGDPTAQTGIIPFVPGIGTERALSPIVYPKRKTHLLRIIVLIVVLAFAIGIYLIWQFIPSTPSISPSPIIQQSTAEGLIPKVSSSQTAASTDGTDESSGNMQVYIVGAVQHPGVYTLPATARVYELLQAAGGPLPNANLVGINLAARLSDGQEIYVTLLGETPPPESGSLPGTNSGGASSAAGSNSASSSAKSSASTIAPLAPGQLVNINTASAAEMKQQLHVSSKTAQDIANYRQQHGPYAAVSDLLNVVSKSIYDKIKNEVTV